MNYLEELLRETGGAYDTLFAELRKWSVTYTDHINDIHEQVRHDGDHSDHMLHYAALILQRKLEREPDFLQPVELFILMAAFYLHDIGMHKDWREFLDIHGSRNNLSQDERTAIRTNHARISGYGIRTFKENLPGSLEKGLPPEAKALLTPEVIDVLAFVCESHNVPQIGDHLAAQIPRLFPQSGLKIPVLAALVQLCDGLHMDESRLHGDRFLDELKKWVHDETLDAHYSDEDWKRFFQCYYVHETRIIPWDEKGNTYKIEVHVCFHPDENPVVRELLMDKYHARLTEKRNGCATVLQEHGDIHFLGGKKLYAMEPSAEKEKIPARLMHVFEIKLPRKKRPRWPAAVAVAAGLLLIAFLMVSYFCREVFVGQVVNEGQGIPGVRVEMINIPAVEPVLTDERGNYRIVVPWHLTKTSYIAKFSKSGYEFRTRKISSGEEAPARIGLGKVTN